MGKVREGVEILYEILGDGDVPISIIQLHKNKRVEIPKGTRIANLVTTFDPDPRSGVSREIAEVQNRARVVTAWQVQWGPVPWSSAEVRHYHLTFQVVTELQVFPEDY